MNAQRPQVPATVATLVPATATLPSSSPYCSRAPFHFPEIGDQVRFARTTLQDAEIGTVTAREFGTRCIEVTAPHAKPLRLMPGQYKVIST